MCPKYPHRHYNVSKGTEIILNVFGHNFKYRLNQYLSGPIHTRTYIKLTPSFADCTSPIITTGKKAFFFHTSVHLFEYHTQLQARGKHGNRLCINDPLTATWLQQDN